MRLALSLPHEYTTRNIRSRRNAARHDRRSGLGRRPCACRRISAAPHPRGVSHDGGRRHPQTYLPRAARDHAQRRLHRQVPQPIRRLLLGQYRPSDASLPGHRTRSVPARIARHRHGRGLEQVPARHRTARRGDSFRTCASSRWPATATGGRSNPIRPWSIG